MLRIFFEYCILMKNLIVPEEWFPIVDEDGNTKARHSAVSAMMERVCFFILLFIFIFLIPKVNYTYRKGQKQKIFNPVNGILQSADM